MHRLSLLGIPGVVGLSLDGLTFSPGDLYSSSDSLCAYVPVCTIKLWAFESNWTATCETWEGPSSLHRRRVVCQEAAIRGLLEASKFYILIVSGILHVFSMPEEIFTSSMY